MTKTLTLGSTRREALCATGAGLAALLASPAKVAAAARSLDTISVTAADGAKLTGALALPAERARLALVVIHEWWGLNDQMKAVASSLAADGHAAIAVDLFNGSSTDDPARAKAQIDAVKADAARAALKAWLNHARTLAPKIATLGFCFGGGWSLNASLDTPVDGTVIYYGNVDKTAAELAPLKGPVLGHFASRDSYISPAMVQRFEAAMKMAGKALTVYSYDAEHGFANPTTARYDAPDAQLAWNRTTAFLGEIAR